MRHIATSLDIDAPIDAVWAVLTDLDAYSEWNPHVTRATGRLREGEAVTVTVVPAGRRPRTMTATVTALEPLRRLQWVATAGSRLLFEGRHTFTLESLAGDRTRFRNREDLSGLLVPLAVRPDAHRDYETMNEALAARVAALAGATVAGATARETAERTADGAGDRETAV
ncbi:SRPBCC domain-containing protein [Halomarina litorea]|uniref:SRPBCC domain-containing protein n=1 Tax=Halomarina litorea TaxID=2961595 RepID=UPI0020C333F5|nr:SRPBCC domain-containing protein [Halomarina sp. BCD28]